VITNAMQSPNRAEQKIFLALGTMLHDFQIAPQSRRISSTTINQHRINMAAQRAPGVCVQLPPEEERARCIGFAALGFVRSNRGC